MKPIEIAQWVIDNRYPKSETDKISDIEMYHFIADRIHDLTRWISVLERLPTEADGDGNGYVEFWNTRYQVSNYYKYDFVPERIGLAHQFTHWKRITPPEDK
jgi:hypothetical protein